MNNMLKLYEDTIKCAERKNSTNTVKCLRKRLEMEIDSNKDEYLRMLIFCKKRCDMGVFAFIVAVVTFIATVLGIVANKADNDIWICFVGIVYVVMILVFALYSLCNYGKYKTMLEILEHMDINKAE